MTSLSRTAKLGIAAEATDSAYTVPSFTIPFERGTRFRDHIVQLRDSTLRGSDTALQNVQQGPYWSEWTVNTLGYADWAGWLLRAMIGPDQLTAGTVTSFSQPSAAGTTSILLAAPVPAGTVLQLGSGTSTEYAVTGTPAGSGPYTVPIANPACGLRFPHGSGEPAQSHATHVFRQDRTYATVWPSYSLTTDDGAEALGWPGCVLGRLGIKVADTGWLSFAASYSGFPPVAAATFTESESAAQPPAGWAWTITTAGGASARGNTLDLTLSRQPNIRPCCNGQQAPLGIFPGPMRADASYKAIFDTTADLNLYRQALQEPAVWTVTQPALQGGASLAVTTSRSGWTDGAVSLDGSYVSADFKLSGIANTADSAASGVTQAVLVNFWNRSY